MPRYKIVNNVRIELTAEEEAELDAQAEAADLDLNMIRSQRNGQLRGSDWTQIGDASLAGHTAEEWQVYRQTLRDVPQTYNRVSEVVWPMDPPTAAAEAARLAALED
jgi:hypothetical protein